MPQALSEFLGHLEPHHERALVFDLGGGSRVPAGYHVTEFKALEYHTVDCGGMAHRFSETVIELWRTASEPDHAYLGVGKFLSIYHKVSPQVTFSPEAELIFLYGAPGEPAARYAIGRLETTDSELIVHLEPDGVRCKGAERKQGAALEALPVASGCCSASQLATAENTVTPSNLCC